MVQGPDDAPVGSCCSVDGWVGVPRPNPSAERVQTCCQPPDAASLGLTYNPEPLDAWCCLDPYSPCCSNPDAVGWECCQMSYFVNTVTMGMIMGNAKLPVCDESTPNPYCE